MHRNTILIVDDLEVNRVILHTLFQQEYDLLEAENGEQAVLLAKEYRDSLAAILLDLVMPVKSGYQVMAELAQNGLLANIPVVVITSEDSAENEVRAFDLGAADIIIKPFEAHVVRRRVRNAVELNRHKVHLEEMLEEQAARLRESRDVVMDALSSVIEHRSAETGQHVLRIRMFTKVLLENVMRCCPEYDLNERAIGVITEAAALHDIGKIAIPDTILNKPGRLTPEEFEIMKTHTVKGCEILNGLDRMGDKEYLRYAYNICRYHHERWDGSGYPDGLVGDNTPICAQAAAIADCYDALTTDRVYKKAIPSEKAMTMILNGECGVFSPKLLECLKNVREPFYELSSSYADGRAARREAPAAPARAFGRIDRVKSAPELGQLKYLTLLRYMGATVLEADMDSGIYHLVHQHNEDFQDLRMGDTFEESLRIFAQRAIYPEDRENALGLINGGTEEFFSSGLMKRSWSYRVFHCATGEYLWYDATALRVEIDNPKHHKLLIVWKEREQPPVVMPEAEVPGIPSIQALSVGVHQCVNDQWFTMTYVNEGFISLFGYSREEIRARFQDRYIEMIHPDDRQAVCRKYLEQATMHGIPELEYRVIDRQGRIVWVLDKSRQVMGNDGREYINGILTDITQVKAAQEELRLSMERYQIVLDQTNDIIYEWNLQQDHISYSPNWEKRFGYRPVSSSVQAQTASHLFPGDIPRFTELMEHVAAGEPYGEAEVRIAKADGKYLWCRIRAVTQFDDAGAPVKAVGVILDIDEEKRQTQELASRAERDALTQLYNKDTAREKIQQMLNRQKGAIRFAMLLIDLDNFKQVNDTRGHMFGDAVLTEAALCLRGLFRSGDVLARFGGDEFLVFLQSDDNGKFLEEKAERIIEAFRGIYVEELQECNLTCSIGISRCPEDGGDYQSLFQRCDRALYQAKEKGKDCWAIYDDATMSRIFGMDARQLTAAGTRIESGEPAAFTVDSLVPQAFRLLYESGDVETAINAILEMAGRRFNVSRAYIFEDSEDGAWCKNTFEWCNEGIQPEIDALQHVPYASLGEGHKERFDENGIFYCRDIRKLPKAHCDLLQAQGIRSLLQCAVRDGGVSRGFVGFDDCVFLRTWTQEQVDALAFISDLLSTFLLKKRAQDRAVMAAQNLHTVLDNQNAWLYVIDPDTYALHYINAKTQRTVPDARVGMPCYQVFFHRDMPCERCPAKDIRKVHNQTLEVYNPILDIWSMADGSLIRWGDQDACLLACHDIKKYMSPPENRGPGEGGPAAPGRAGPRWPAPEKGGGPSDLSL